MVNCPQKRIGTVVFRLVPPRHYHRHKLSNHQMTRMEGHTIKAKYIHGYTYPSHSVHAGA
ncbi:hypothetical protein BDR04DRAFT_1110729 [Suillus decipiens]|nr:hypothetical protein BDR04DRAFT_1110729 [Suillus decipiens]